MPIVVPLILINFVFLYNVNNVTLYNNDLRPASYENNEVTVTRQRVPQNHQVQVHQMKTWR